MSGDGKTMPAVVPPQGRTCSTCKNYEFDEGNPVGECRARPPTVHVVVVSSLGGAKPVPLAAFPQVKPDTWCGEWRGEWQ